MNRMLEEGYDYHYGDWMGDFLGHHKFSLPLNKKHIWS